MNFGFQTPQIIGPALAYASGQAVPTKLRTGMLLKGLALHLYGTVTATANIALTELSPADEWSIVKNLNISANGNKILLRSLTGEDIRWNHYFTYGRPQVGAYQWATKPVAFDSTIILPFDSPGMRRPFETTLDTRNMDDLWATVTWGAVTDLVSSAGGNFTVNPTLEIIGLESIPAKGADGKPGATPPMFNLQMMHYEFPNLPANLATVALPVNKVYSSIMLGVKDGTANGTGYDVANPLTRVRLRSGNTIFRDIPWNSLDGVQKALTDLADVQTWDGNPPKTSSSTNHKMTAWRMLDLTPEGMFTSALDTRGMSDLTLELVGGSAITKLIVVPTTILQ